MAALWLLVDVLLNLAVLSLFSFWVSSCVEQAAVLDDSFVFLGFLVR